MTHTPAPWTDKYSNPRYKITVGTDTHFVAFMAGDDATAEANARLIAAAPDLLESLKDAHPFITNDTVRARVGAVILKATEAL